MPKEKYIFPESGVIISIHDRECSECQKINRQLTVYRGILMDAQSFLMRMRISFFCLQAVYGMVLLIREIRQSKAI